MLYATDKIIKHNDVRHIQGRIAVQPSLCGAVFARAIFFASGADGIA